MASSLSNRASSEAGERLYYTRRSDRLGGAGEGYKHRMGSENAASLVLSGFSTVVEALVLLALLQVLYYVVSGGIPRTGYYYSRRLRDRNPHVRQGAIRDLVQRADSFSLRLLIDALDDREPAIRMAAVEGLGRCRDPLGVEHLIRMLSDPEIGVQVKTIEALAGTDSPEVIEAISARVLDAEQPVKLASLRVFKDVFMPGMLPVIAKLCLDPEEHVALAACTVACRYGDEALPHLTEVLLDAGEASERVVKTMTTINDRLSIDYLKQAFSRSQNMGTLKEAADALIDIGAPGTADFFIPFIQNPQHPARLHLVWSVPFLFDATVVGPMCKLLVDPDPRIRREATGALDKLVNAINDSRMIDPLIEALLSQEREISLYAARALGQIGTRPVFQRVLRTMYGQQTDELVDFVERTVGYPMSRMVTFEELLLGLDRVMTTSRLTADTLKAIGVIESLLIIMYGPGVRGQHLDEGSEDLLIRGRRSFYPLNPGDLHPLALKLLEYVSSKAESDRFRIAHAS